ncbi:MAG TPA: MFS transporter [Acidimicrobiales bacterium]|nr:MFS transporter [Acidimicrobiales bacterium]
MTSADRPFGARYLAVLASAVICYAALGAVLREVPDYVQHHLGGSALEVGLTVGAPSLTGALLRPVGGRAADRFGPAPVLMVGALVMAVGVGPAVIADLPALLVSRLLVGAGEALMMSAAVLWLLTLAGPDRRGVALGHIGLANYAGLAAGPLLAEAVGAGSHTDALWLMAAILPVVGTIGAALLPHPEPRPTARDRSPDAGAGIRRQTLRPGIGLLLVNVGYVSVLSFGAAAANRQGLHAAALIVPLFGIGVIASRTLLAGVPDRLGGPRTLVLAVLTEGVGLVAFGEGGRAPLVIAGLVILSLGQGLAVPALGLIALGPIPAEQQGAAAGMFFAYFDAGVGLGGPAVGAAAGAFDPQVAIVMAGAAVAAAAPVVLVSRISRNAINSAYE